MKIICVQLPDESFNILFCTATFVQGLHEVCFYSDSGPDPTPIAQQLLGMGINIYTIGLGPSSSVNQNNRLAAISGTASNVFILGTNYYNLLNNTMATTIQNRTLHGTD